MLPPMTLAVITSSIPTDDDGIVACKEVAVAVVDADTDDVIVVAALLRLSEETKERLRLLLLLLLLYLRICVIHTDPGRRISA